MEEEIKKLVLENENLKKAYHNLKYGSKQTGIGIEELNDNYFELVEENDKLEEEIRELRSQLQAYETRDEYEACFDCMRMAYKNCDHQSYGYQ